MTKTTQIRLAVAMLACALTVGALSGCKKQEQTPAQVVDVVDIDLVQATPQPAATPAPTPADQPSQPTPRPKPAEPEPLKLAQAKMKNKDVVGWIKIPNTKIDYPILLAPDNDYYLDRNELGKKSKSGAIFMDFRNADEKQRRHLILYGHNMRNGTMFHDLNNYKVKDFFEKSKMVDLWLFDEHFTYEVYSEFVVTTDIGFIDTKFTSDDQFVQYMDELNRLSKFPNEQNFSKDDTILTLATCTYEYDNSRCVVQAKKVS